MPVPFPHPLPQPINESTQQSWHLVGPQQIVVADVLLLLKYLAKSKCRMRSTCVECPIALSHWSSWKAQGSSASYFLNHGAFSELKKAMDPLLKKVYIHTSSVYQFRDSGAWLKLTTLNALRNSAPHWRDPVRLGLRDRAKCQHYGGTRLYAHLPAMWPWTSYIFSLLLMVFRSKMGSFTPFTRRIFEALKNETLLGGFFFFFFLTPGTL